MTANRYEFDLDWTDAELHHYRDDERRRTTRHLYWPYAVLFGIGFLTAVAALLMDAVRPDDAKIIAFVGTLAAFGGWFTAVWAVHRQAKHTAANDPNRQYRVVVDSAGMRFLDVDTDSLALWSGCAGIETSPRLIRVIMKRRRDICFPRRYLGSDAARDGFVAFVRQNIAAAEVDR
jgi:hypothetical protein